MTEALRIPVEAPEDLPQDNMELQAGLATGAARIAATIHEHASPETTAPVATLALTHNLDAAGHLALATHDAPRETPAAPVAAVAPPRGEPREPTFKEVLAGTSRQVVRLQQHLHYHQSPTHNGEGSPAATLISMEQQRIIGDAWARLNPFQRHSLVLASCHGLTPVQIGSLVNLSPAVVGKVLKGTEKIIGVTLQDLATEHIPGASKVISTEPYTELFWRPLGQQTGHPSQLNDPVRIRHFKFGTALICVDSPLGQPTPQPHKCAILASLGLSNYEIQHKLYITEDTVKSHLKTFFSAHNLSSRAHLTSYFLATKYFVVEHYGDPLEATEREQEIIGYISQGLGNADIATKTGLAEDTVKSHTRKISRKTGLHGREKITLAALTSRPKGSEGADNLPAQELPVLR